MREGGRLPLLTKKDVQAIVLLAASYLATALVPRRFDARAIAVAAAVLARLIPGRARRRSEQMRSALGDASGSSAWDDEARLYALQRVEDRWLRGRFQHREPPDLTTSVSGLDHYHRALERGNGVILWRARFCDSPAINAAIGDAGVRTTHLSVDRHGGGQSRLGVSLVGPWWSSAENIGIERRVLIPTEGGLDYLRDLVGVLEENGTLSIFIEGVPKSRAPAEVEIFGWKTTIPTGGPALAHRTGAVLLPVFASNPAPLHYEVTIEPPIEIDQDSNRRECISRASCEMARRLEAAIRRSPAAWTGWREFGETPEY